MIRWYGVFYVVAIGLGAWLLPFLEHYRTIKFNWEERLALVSWILIGVVLGGRLGYVFFYEPVYFLAHPRDILAINQGGMASHGGFIGVAIALILFSRVYKKPLWAIADVIIIPAALGLALGRIGNLINGELPGILITGSVSARYPWPLLEALKNVALAGLCYDWLKTKQWPPGKLTAWFLVFYSAGRIVLELVRQPAHVLGQWAGVAITGEQVLTCMLLLASLGLLIRLRHTKGNANNNQTIRSAVSKTQ